MSDFKKILDAVLADAKKRKLSLDDLGKMILTKDHPALKDLDAKMLKDTLGRSRETIIEQAQNHYRLESIVSEQAYWADKILSMPELAAMTDEQRNEIACKVIEVGTPEWKAKISANALRDSL
jgi:hypothetical protein